MKKIGIIILFLLALLFLASCGLNDSKENAIIKEYSEVDEVPLLDFLNNNISASNTVDEIIDVFEEMCKTPIEEDLLLLEYGVYNFTEEKMFYFDLVRQYPDGDGEYYQIRVSLTFVPDKDNAKLKGTFWSDDTDKNFFDYIRESSGYKYAKISRIKSVDIRIDQT